MKPIETITILALLMHNSHGYTVKYYDCHNITTVTTYKASTMCNSDEITTNEPQNYVLLQQASTEEIQGWSCQIIMSCFIDYCDAYGHSKHVQTPVIEATLDITPTQCLDMIATSTFRTPEGIMRKVEDNHSNKLLMRSRLMDSK